MSEKRTEQTGSYGEYDNLAFHPYNVMLMLLLMAITVLFLALAIAFVYMRVDKGEGAIKLPWQFALSTFILLLSSWTMHRAKKAYQEDNTTAYQAALRLTVLATLLFLGTQLYAWTALFNQNIFLVTSNSSSYLYLLCSMHFAHVLAGLPFLFLFIRATNKYMKEPVTVLVYFSDPEKRLKLRLLSVYWHFLDGLWIFLVLFFLVNYLASGG